MYFVVRCFFFFKQKTAYDMLRSLVGSEMCIRDSFEGVVIGRSGGGIDEALRVRRVTHGIGVERLFPLHSPIVDDVITVRHGKVRRSKLYYLRDRVGKKARVKEQERDVVVAREKANKERREAEAAAIAAEAAAAQEQAPAE